MYVNLLNVRNVKFFNEECELKFSMSYDLMSHLLIAYK